MKKIFKKALKISLLTIVTGILTITLILLFPQTLFAKKFSYKKFKVYSNHNVDVNIKAVLDDALSLVQKSELYDSNYKYNIILCHNSFYNKIDNTILGRGGAARATLNNVVIKVKIDPSSNLAFPIFPKACEIHLAYALAHEMIHCLQAKKYGIMKFNPFRHPEFWKVEGYPEVISRRMQLSNSGYNLANEIDRYVDLQNKVTDMWIAIEEGGCEFPNYYYKGRLMTEFLMDIKHLSYDQILRDTTSETSIFQEMLEWKDSNKILN